MPLPRKLDDAFVQQSRNRQRLSDIAYRAIREAIVSGRIRRGEKLLQAQLASELGLTQVTVREALSRLVADGLAVQEPYRGVRALSVSKSEVEGVLHLRGMLEGRAMELAASRVTAEDLARMRELLPAASPTPPIVVNMPARGSHRDFHWIAIGASGDRHLMHLLGYVWDLLSADFAFFPSTEEAQQNIARAELAHHTALLEALERRDGKAARAVAEEHIRSTVAYTLAAWPPDQPLNDEAQPAEKVRRIEAEISSEPGPGHISST